MPLKIATGLTEKVGLPAYSSLGASCHVEFEADTGLLHEDLEGFHSQVRRAYVVCREAVQAELNRQLEGRNMAPANGAPPPPTSAANRPETSGNGHQGHLGDDRANGHGGQPASPRQHAYLEQLARQIHGLGVRRLDALSEAVCGKPVAALTSRDASGLIHTLKAIQAGALNLDHAMNGGAP